MCRTNKCEFTAVADKFYNAAAVHSWAVSLILNDASAREGKRKQGMNYFCARKLSVYLFIFYWGCEWAWEEKY